jgi:DNA-binding transcriptional MerR regulator
MVMRTLDGRTGGEYGPTSAMSHRGSYGRVTHSGQHITTDQIEADRTMRAAASPAGYSGTTAAKIVGISYRQLDYWARTDLVRPSLSEAAGSGSRRSYSYRDLLELRVIKSLLDAGIKLESVRVAFEYLREYVETDIASAHLVISGSDVLLCDGDELIDVMRRGGQGVLNVLAIGGVKSDLDAQLAGPSPVASSLGAVAVAL